jgi:glycosyltransferase involved in cell wall biosynthesis
MVARSVYPLFSLVVISFNQETYVREAIESALAQDYQNLEIVISDDCSTDATWAIIEQVVRSYNGPHRVILNRNASNRGIVGNYQKAVSLCSGEWIVGLAGDDWAFPNRVSHIHQLVSMTPHVYAVGTACEVINPRGKVIGYRMHDTDLPSLRLPILIGASAAYHMECFKRFAVIEDDLHVEDIIYPFRALLLGRVLLSNTPTIRYRVCGSNASQSPSYKKSLNIMLDLEAKNRRAYQQRMTDTIAFHGISGEMKSTLLSMHEAYIAESHASETQLRRLLCYYDEKGFARLAYLFRLDVKGLRRSSARFKCAFLVRQWVLLWRIYGWLKLTLTRCSRILGIPDSRDHRMCRAISLEDYIHR